jgi:hypothetical protein
MPLPCSVDIEGFDIPHPATPMSDAGEIIPAKTIANNSTARRPTPAGL